MKGDIIRKIATKAIIFAKKASPYVLAALSAAGTVAVTVEAVKEIRKNTPKVTYIKPDEEPSKPEETDDSENRATIVYMASSDVDIWKHKIITAVKTYYKPILFGISSITSLAGSVFIFNKRQRNLIIAMNQMADVIKRYSQAMTATAAAGGTIAFNKLEPNESKEYIQPDEDDGKKLFYDPVFKYEFRASIEDFLDAAYKTSTQFAKDGGVSVRYFYKCMNVPPPIEEDPNGYVGWGWYMDEENDWFDFYGEDAGYVGIQCTPVTVNDDFEYIQIGYFQAPMFNMNGRMLDGKGRNFYDMEWLND